MSILYINNKHKMKFYLKTYILRLRFINIKELKYFIKTYNRSKMLLKNVHMFMF